MDVMLAAFHLVRDYPGGAVALGPMIGKGAATLSHEVNPNYPTAKLGLDDAVRLSVLTRDKRIATAFAAEVGAMLVPLPDAGMDCTSFGAISAMAREFSEMVGRVGEALADGRVSSNELSAVQAEAARLVAAVQTTVQHVATVAERSRTGVERVA